MVLVALLLLVVALVIVFGSPPDEMLGNHLAGLQEILAEARPDAQATVTLGPLLPEQTPTEKRTARAVAPVTSTPKPAATTARTPTLEPTKTPPPELVYPAPVLLTPSDDFAFTGSDSEIWLRWEPVGELGEDDYYVVSLHYQKDGSTVSVTHWGKSAEWLVPADTWEHDADHPEYEWAVVAMRQTGVGEDGEMLGVAVGDASDTRRFVWE